MQPKPIAETSRVLLPNLRISMVVNSDGKGFRV